MKSKRFTLTLASLVGGLLLAAGPIAAQTPPPAAQQMPDSVREMLTEMQQIQQQLATIQEQTLEANAELRAQQEATEDAVFYAMVEADPGVEQTIERLEEMGQEIRAAQAEQDTTRMRELLMEGQQAQQRLQAAQAQAMQRDDVSNQVQEYRDDLLEAMKAHDPQTEQLIARMEDLAQRLQAAAGEN